MLFFKTRYRIQPTAGLLLLCGFVLSVCAMPKASAQQPATAVISLFDEVSHSGSLVKLEDVAHIEAKDELLQSQLGSVILGPGPLAGQSTTLAYGDIRNKLIARGVDLATVELIGQSQVQVSHPQSTTTGLPSAAIARRQSLILKDLSRQLQQYAQRMEPALEQAELTIERDSFPIELTQRSQLQSVQFFGGQAPWDQWQQIQMVFQNEAGQQSSAALRIRWTPWPYGLALRASVLRGDILREDHLAWKQVPPNQSPLTNLEDVLGMQVRGNLKQGTLIDLDDLEQVPLARRGEIVSVTIRQKGLSLRRQFKALGDGSRGDVIRLMAMDGKAVVTAKLIGMREAIIESSFTQAASSQPTGLQLQQAPVPALQSVPQALSAQATNTPAFQQNRVTTAEYRAQPLGAKSPLIRTPVSRISHSPEQVPQRLSPARNPVRKTSQANRPMALPIQQTNYQSTSSNAVQVPHRAFQQQAEPDVPVGYQAAYPRRPGR